MPNGKLTPDSWSVEFVEGIYSAEDLARVPGTRWLVASGMAGPDCQGHLYAVDTERLEATEIFPDRGFVEPRPEAYGEHPPPDLSDFSAVGVGLRPGEDGVHTLYVVNHGARAGVEVFSIDATGEIPSATWIGVIPYRQGVLGNAVTPLAGGGILATNYMSTEDPDALAKVLAGEDTGNVHEWHPDSGWADVPGTEVCSANGVDASPDGKWCFVAAWATRRFVRVSRGAATVARDEIDVPSILPDNVKWAPSGRVLVTGQESDAKTVFDGVYSSATYDVPLRVFAIDPESLEAEELFRFEQPGGFGTAATALEVGESIWVSSARSDRIAVFRRR
jgi:hypothetical protein